MPPFVMRDLRLPHDRMDVTDNQGQDLAISRVSRLLHTLITSRVSTPGKISLLELSLTALIGTHSSSPSRRAASVIGVVQEFQIALRSTGRGFQ